MDRKIKKLARDSKLANRCKAHLAQEIELLEKYIEISSSVYENVGSTTTEVPDSDALLDSVAGQSQSVSDSRYQLRVDIAEYLDVPVQQATIRVLVEHVDDVDAESIRQQRSKLLELESVIQQQNHTNSLLIRQTMDLYQRIALELTAPKTGAPTYSPSGELTTNNSSTFLQTDC